MSGDSQNQDRFPTAILVLEVETWYTSSPEITENITIGMTRGVPIKQEPQLLQGCIQDLKKGGNGLCVSKH